jgi:hypothetical protein
MISQAQIDMFNNELTVPEITTMCIGMMGMTGIAPVELRFITTDNTAGEYPALSPNGEVVSTRLITIRENSAFSNDTVEILDGKTLLGQYEMTELNPHKLAEVLRWFGHPVRHVEYMFPHDIE